MQACSATPFLDPYPIGSSEAFAINAARIPGGGGLENQDLSFFIRGRAVLNAVRHHHHFARAEFHYVVSKLHPKPPAPHQKQLVFRLVMMPGKFTLKLNKLYFLAIEFRDHFWTPVLVEQRELFLQIDGGHVATGSFFSDITSMRFSEKVIDDS